MGQSLDQILAEVRDGDTLNVTMVSNQDNGIASYAVGGLVFHTATGGLHGTPFRPARLESSQPFQMFFSDRKLNIDPPPAPGTFGVTPRQPFDANATEQMDMSISLGTGTHEMELGVFGSRSAVTLSPIGDLLAGLGPSLGNSAAGAFVLSFNGIFRQPH
jgi:hypothetical protein